jgi:predicted metal-dependent enzyme (double-stranded beta helix superfamily)
MQDEYVLDTPEVRAFIEQVQAIKRRAGSVREALATIRPYFNRLMTDQSWLPPTFRQPDAVSSMGGGIAFWLLYRAGNGSLSLFALVVPPGSSTPVHDHLAWGLVGVYVGEQSENVYEPIGSAHTHDHVQLRLVATNQLHEGDFYELIPPTGDIHRVTTTSATPSIPLHLLGNDTGCVWRHRYDPDAGTAAAFRSGYTNRACELDAER